jgi:ATP-dependent protease ClpP protease subunit
MLLQRVEQNHEDIVHLQDELDQKTADLAKTHKTDVDKLSDRITALAVKVATIGGTAAALLAIGELLLKLLHST